MSQTARWYPCACGAEHDTPTCPFGAVGTFDLDEATPIERGLYGDPKQPDVYIELPDVCGDVMSEEDEHGKLD